MKINCMKTFLLLSLFSLTSCGSPKVVPISSYFDESLTFHEGYKVLQITDMHWSVNTDANHQGAYLENLVKKIAPDYIMITGDSLLGATTSTAEALIKVIENWNVPFGITWGNHDREGEYSPNWLSNRFKNVKNSHYNEVDDDVFGRGNYVVSLMDSTTKKAKWNLYSLDSNSYPQSYNGVYYNYDVIHEDQVNWFNQAAEYSKTQNGSEVPSLAYFHIPLFQWAYSYLENQDGLIGELLEKGSYKTGPKDLLDQFAKKNLLLKNWVGYKDTGFFDAGVSHNVRGFFCGHDHSNDWGSKYTSLKGTAFVGYGVKSGTELYYAHSTNRDFDVIGGSLSTLHGDGSFDLTHYYMQDDEAYTLIQEEVKGL
ncbi:MAG: metallophosphoesterase [Bacilli bacterium]|nr:metallophosphoesterase [Bacilli bacterium]